MQEQRKQRLIGLLVLTALAVIFLPSLFHQREPVVIDTATLIPPAPVVAPVIVPKPVKPEAFAKAQAPVAAEKTVNAEATRSETLKAEAAKPETRKRQMSETNKPTPVSQTPAVFDTGDPAIETPSIRLQQSPPQLNKAGVPKGWLLQVASLKLQKSAEKLVKTLRAEKYAAYWERAETAQGEWFRVFVGPYIDQRRAQQAKRQIDKAQKVDARVLRFNPLSGD
ncbi:MAG: SPOR domain-containing protein [Cellvibrionaceae bacterium]|nr:SPOR domain-containing protein [Cellvibrionaceae bacterium]